MQRYGAGIVGNIRPRNMVRQRFVAVQVNASMPRVDVGAAAGRSAPRPNNPLPEIRRELADILKLLT